MTYTPKSFWDPDYTMPDGSPPIVRPVETVVEVPKPEPKGQKSGADGNNVD